MKPPKIVVSFEPELIRFLIERMNTGLTTATLFLNKRDLTKTARHEAQLRDRIRLYRRVLQRLEAIRLGAPEHASNPSQGQRANTKTTRTNKSSRRTKEPD